MPWPKSTSLGQVDGRAGGDQLRLAMSQRATPPAIEQPMLPVGLRKLAVCTVRTGASLGARVGSLRVVAAGFGAVSVEVVPAGFCTVTVFVSLLPHAVSPIADASPSASAVRRRPTGGALTPASPAAS
jgi:hypothetical protein